MLTRPIARSCLKMEIALIWRLPQQLLLQVVPARLSPRKLVKLELSTLCVRLAAAPRLDGSRTLLVRTHSHYVLLYEYLVHCHKVHGNETKQHSLKQSRKYTFTPPFPDKALQFSSLESQRRLTPKCSGDKQRNP
eukprot:6205056-Pleurochrysis_carterae.AAC.1